MKNVTHALEGVVDEVVKTHAHDLHEIVVVEDHRIIEQINLIMNVAGHVAVMHSMFIAGKAFFSDGSLRDVRTADVPHAWLECKTDEPLGQVQPRGVAGVTM